MKSQESYAKATFWVAVGSSACIILLACWTLYLTKKSMTEPKFEITFEQATPAGEIEISSQKANPHWVFRPRPDIYDKANRGKTDGKKDRITITNISKSPSPVTFVEIAVEEPFAIALISAYAPGYGWLDSSSRTVRTPNEQNYRRVVLEITKIIAGKHKLEVYSLVVYRKTDRKKYEGEDRIDQALKVTVHSSTQKIESPSARSFSLEF